MNFRHNSPKMRPVGGFFDSLAADISTIFDDIFLGGPSDAQVASQMNSIISQADLSPSDPFSAFQSQPQYASSSLPFNAFSEVTPAPSDNVDTTYAPDFSQPNWSPFDFSLPSPDLNLELM